MRRNIEIDLISWKSEKNPTPVLIRGARQVGKSFAITQFGHDHFESCVTIDFDLNPQFVACFQGNLEPTEICASLSVLSRQEIVPGKTLLFLDEIQQCPRAIMALRYFHEKMPDLHVIGAGSLLEFAVASEDFRMPVGRIRYLHMYPLSFAEFLDAAGERLALENLRAHDPGKPFPEAIHGHLLALVRTYMTIGGMPAVVKEYVASGNMELCARIQAGITQTYRDDFGKYAKQAAIPHLRNIFAAVPKMVGRKFKYSAVDETVPSRELKSALELLEMAGVVRRVKQTSGAGLPMEAGASDRNFKVVFLDVGLMQNLCGLAGEIFSAKDLLAVHAGAVAEQFVAQEIQAHADIHSGPGLYYWVREAKSSNAEVDYLLASGAKILPIEVKAGKSGTLRSLHMFLLEHEAPLGIRVSQGNMALDGKLFSCPLYALEGLTSAIQIIQSV